MNWNSSFFWKLVYGGLIVAMLVPLYVLGQPATSSPQGGGSGGGVLARMRSEHGLSQANLGEIDPASESMKLATLGLRGVAANILWEKANEYKKTEDWDNLSATLNQITKLQPNFISVWEFQSHNLAYNVSVEFDDYEHRYHWVKKGIDFLITGTDYNSREPRLLQTVGHYMGTKIGRSDEYVQFRRMFRQDSDYHETLATHVDLDDPEARTLHDQLPDNWLVSRLWFIKSETMVDSLDRPIRGKSPLMFFRERPMALMNYSTAVEEEGHFGQVARAAWSDALREWLEYGRRLLPTSWGIHFQLTDYDTQLERIRGLEADLNKLTGDAREAIKQERLAALTDEERAVYVPNEQDLITKEFTEEQIMLYYDVRDKMRISDMEVADRAPSEVRDQARRQARKLSDARELLNRLDSYRQQVNYGYWHTRAEAEQTDIAVEAREHLYRGGLAWDDAKLESAKSHFEQAWDLWYELFEKFPSLRDELNKQDLRKPLEQYLKVLAQLGEDLPEDFKLEWILKDPYAGIGMDDGSYPPGMPGNPDDFPGPGPGLAPAP